jgi:methyl-accepting chemotaxis protein
MMSSAEFGQSAQGGNSLSRLFSDRKIGTKIAIGFALILAITVMISFIANSTLGKIEDSVNTLTQRVSVVGLVRDIDREFISMRRDVMGFALTGHEDDAAAAGKTRETLSALVAKALAQTKDPERLAKTRELTENFTAYGKQFDQLAASRRALDKQTKEVMDPTGLKLRVDFEELQQAATASEETGLLAYANEGLKQVMMARLNVNKVLGRHDAEAAKAAEKSFADLKTALTKLDTATQGSKGRKAFEEINTLVKTYHAGYDKAAHDSHEVAKLLDVDMAKLGQAVATLAQTIKQSGVADEQQIEKDTESLILSTERMLLTLAIGGLVLGILLAWLVGRAISIPTRKIGDVLLQLANGNKNVDVPYADRGDEVGDNARAAKTFKENLLRIEQIEAQQKETELQAAAQRKTDMRRLADEFEGAVGNIVNTVSSASTQLEASARTLTTTAERSQEITLVVASASEEASANVQSVASATEELTSSVNEISRQVQESAKIATGAVGQAQKTNDCIDELSKAASRIGAVVELINTIAGQTNLLALNATIEAARAGEAGRGFAVVASEVKALAEQTAKATDEIGQQINGIQAATQESVGAIKEISVTIGRIAEISSTIASAVEEQGAATQEISRNVQQAAEGTMQVSSNIGDVQRGAGETGAASTQVLNAAQSLSRDSNQLKLEVVKFLDSVRAA